MRQGQRGVVGRLGIAAAVLCWTILPAAAQEALRGVALVIGQSAYEEASGLRVLKNPENDARALDDLLDDMGFEVERALDADADELKRTLTEFAEDAADADVALVYYSGHGIEAVGQSYLIPVDADMSSPVTAGQSLVPLQALLDELRREVDVTIVLFDACRTNSFAPGQMVVLPGESAPVEVSPEGLGPGASAGRGTLLSTSAGAGQGLGAVIGFAASPGRAALDGEGENSPYAAALLKHLGAGGYGLADIMTLVTQEVYLETASRQLPWTNSSLTQFVRVGTAIEETGTDEALIRAGRRELLLQISDTPADLRHEIEEASTGDVSLAPLFAAVLEREAAITSDEERKTLVDEAVAALREMQRRFAIVPSDPEVASLYRLAREAYESGALPIARAYLARAKDAVERGADQLDELESVLIQRRLENALVYELSGDLIAVEQGPRGALGDYRAAASQLALLPPDDTVRQRIHGKLANALIGEASVRVQQAHATASKVFRVFAGHISGDAGALEKRFRSTDWMISLWRQQQTSVINEAIDLLRGARTDTLAAEDIETWINNTEYLARALSWRGWEAEWDPRRGIADISESIALFDEVLRLDLADWYRVGTGQAASSRRTHLAGLHLEMGERVRALDLLEEARAVEDANGGSNLAHVINSKSIINTAIDAWEATNDVLFLDRWADAAEGYVPAETEDRDLVLFRQDFIWRARLLAAEQRGDRKGAVEAIDEMTRALTEAEALQLHPFTLTLAAVSLCEARLIWQRSFAGQSGIRDEVCAHSRSSAAMIEGFDGLRADLEARIDSVAAGTITIDRAP